MIMDWFAWLSKTGLNPALVYEYGLAFNQNELEEDDLSYFDHEFLQSMGISIAKHRLEILKLARKRRRPDALLPRLLIAIKSTKRRVEKYVKSWVNTENCSPSPPSSSAIVLVHKDNYSRTSNGYYGASLKRRKKETASPARGRLLLTNGSSTPARNVTSNSISGSPAVYALTEKKSKKKKKKKKDGVEEAYWSAGVDDVIRWDSLFQDLKPT